MISVNSINKVYQSQHVVSDVSFEVKKGDTLAILGTSGSGKTTILKMLNRLVDLSSGSIQIEGQDIQRIKPETLRRRIGYVIQHSGLFPHYTVCENIGVVPSLLGWSTERVATRVRELVRIVGLSDSLLGHYPRQLSGGQQQRVGIARALAVDPPVILMDEPFGALDPITKQQMAQEFASLGVLREKTVVLVTHDVLEAFVLGNQICLLDQGKLQQIGTPKELLFYPNNEFVRSFFSIQHFRLALEVLTIGDIASYGSMVNSNSHVDTTVDLPQETSLFEALNRLDEQTVDQIVTKTARATVRLDRMQLLSGFYAYQQNIDH